MIVNGQYIDYDEKSIADIQTRLNKSDDLKPDLKSGIEKPKEVYEPENNNNVWDFNNFNLFDGEADAERMETYAYYREMDRMEFIHRGLEIVADDSTQSNTDGDVIKIHSDDEKIKDDLYDLFIERLDVNNELWNIVYDTARFGDNFYEIVPDDYKNPKKIIFIRYLKPDNVQRIEEEGGRLSHFEYKADDSEKEKRIFGETEKKDEQEERHFKLQPWQVIHFKVQTDRDNDPYGGSLLKSGMRTYRRLSLLEDIILVYRVSRAPERRVFKINVGNMNYADAQRFVQKIKEKYRTQSFIDENGNMNKKANMLSITSDIFIPVREGGQGTEVDTLQGGEALKTIEDLDYFKNKILRTMNIPLSYLGDESDRSRGCIIGSTKIKLADGRELSVEEITKEYEEGKQNYVYSIDEETLEWVIKPISWAGITGKDMEVVKVTLDNGKEITCTPDHKFMMRDGTYCEAGNLRENSSLMPIYSKLSDKNDGDKLSGYEMLFNNNNGKWEYTHRIAKKEELKEAKNNIVVHHASFDRLNNNPNELVLMDKDEHFKLHSSLAKELSKDKDLLKRRNESIKKFYNSEEGKKVLEIKIPKAVYSQKRYDWLHSEKHKQLKREQVKRQRENGGFIVNEEGRNKISNYMKKRWEDEEYKEKTKDVSSKAGSIKNKNNPIYRKLTKEEIIENFENGMTTQELSESLNTSRGTLKKTLRRWGYKDWYEFCEENSLIPKERVNHKVLSVEKVEEKYTVYDLTIDEQSPNFSTSSGVVIHNSLSQLDIKFSRFIERIQSQIIKGLNKIAALELFFQGYKKEQLYDFALELTPPSNIKEMVDIDIINQRMGLVGTIQGLNIYSNTWIMRNILKHSEREIAEINMEKQQEAEQEGGEEGGDEFAGGGGEFGGEMGGDEFGGEEMPPEEGGEEPTPEEGGGEEEAPAEEPEVASTLINMLGKDFIVENKDDFFKILKASEKFMKEQNREVEREKISMLFERAAEIVNTRPSKKIKKRTPEIRKQFIVNEMGGLSFSKDNKKHSMTLFEGTNEDVVEKEVYLSE